MACPQKREMQSASPFLFFRCQSTRVYVLFRNVFAAALSVSFLQNTGKKATNILQSCLLKQEKERAAFQPSLSHTSPVSPSSKEPQAQGIRANQVLAGLPSG